MTSKVRINLANPAELADVPGLSRDQADAIVRFRSEHGPIRDDRQLADILGGHLPAAISEIDYAPAADTAPEAPGG